MNLYEVFTILIPMDAVSASATQHIREQPRKPLSVLPARNARRMERQIAMVVSRMCILLLLLVEMVGCTPEFLGKYALPRKELVKAGGSHPVLGLLELTASTNCAEVGEVVTFTVRYKNETADPITLVSDPLLDIVIVAHPQGGNATIPQQRWSASTHYPATINPVVQPGEERTYTWQWKADGIYAQDSVDRVTITAEAQVSRLQNALPQGIEQQVSIGVSRIEGNRPGTSIPCRDLRQ